MLTKVIGVAFAVILAPVYLFGLAGLLIWSPVLLWRRLRPSKPRRGPQGVSPERRDGSAAKTRPLL